MQVQDSPTPPMYNSIKELGSQITHLHGTVYSTFFFLPPLSFIAQPYVVNSRLEIGFGKKKTL
jgi:hypothetical protein